MTRPCCLCIIMPVGAMGTARVKGVFQMSDELNKVIENVKGKVQEVLDKTDVDEKVLEAVKGIPGKLQALLDKTDIDEKIVDGAKNLTDKVGELLKGKE